MKHIKKPENPSVGKKKIPKSPILIANNSGTKKLSPPHKSLTATTSIKTSYVPPRRKSTESPKNPSIANATVKKQPASAQSSPSITLAKDLKSLKDSNTASKLSPESFTSVISSMSPSLSKVSISVTPALLPSPAKLQNTRTITSQHTLSDSAVSASSSIGIKPSSMPLLNPTVETETSTSASAISTTLSTLLTIASTTLASPTIKKEKFENQKINSFQKPNEECVLQVTKDGKMTITSPIPQKTKLKIIGGDLYVESNIGNEVSIEVTNGNLFCDNIGQFCNITANEIVCDDVGFYSRLTSMNGSIHAKNIEAHATLHVLEGDVLAEIVSPEAIIMLGSDRTIYAKQINPNSIKGSGKQYTIEELDTTLVSIYDETNTRDTKNKHSAKK